MKSTLFSGKKTLSAKLEPNPVFHLDSLALFSQIFRELMRIKFDCLVNIDLLFGIGGQIEDSRGNYIKLIQFLQKNKHIASKLYCSLKIILFGLQNQNELTTRPKLIARWF